MKQIGIIVGSLREGSYSKAVAEYMVSQLAKIAQPFILEIKSLPLYNPDLDAQEIPPEWVKFRNNARNMSAFLFVTPEYNRSIPAALKNALDVGSRPYDDTVWNKKPAAIISISPGKIGGFGVNHHLRQTFSCLNLYTMPQPEAYLGEIDQSLDEQGSVVNERTTAFLDHFAAEMIEWIKNFS